MDDYAVGYRDGLTEGTLHPEGIDGFIALALTDHATPPYDLGFIAGLAAAKVRAGEDG